ncbi:MAG: L,D-transpeptidase catalytic domain [Chlorobi bacterium]|nr:L,D-transpeptidase catalytic domain [Chlorobiota bacterium]
MKIFTHATLTALLLAAAAMGCDIRSERSGKDDTIPKDQKPTLPDTTTAQAPPVPPAIDTMALPVTLPLVDAFFADSTFTTDLKTTMGLTDEQIAQLRTTARDETARLRETTGEDYMGSTAEAQTLAAGKIREIVGPEKAAGLMSYIRTRWGGDMTVAGKAGAVASDSSHPAVTGSTYAVPADTRIVVNAPEYRMDLFRDGKLVKSYRIGIGYPEFPLPAGERRATSIIFNPTWTPPDEPWVEGSSKIKAGKKVEAGSALNPLGPIKIPIGLPSLIHGGKLPSRLGTFASHGCVGLTTPQIEDVAARLAEMSGTQLPDSLIQAVKKNRTVTKDVKLAAPITVELRYETIVVEDGKLHILRDVYDRNTNTEEHLKAVLAGYGVTIDQLSADERSRAMAALTDMSRDANGKLDTARADSAGSAAAKGTPAPKSQSAKVTRNVKGAKDVVIDIAALAGKGYPVPVDMDTGAGRSALAAASQQSARKR